MKKRLFIAFPVNKGWLESLNNYLEQFPKEKSWRFTSKENLHLTVYFLGYIEEENIPEIEERLRKIASETKTIEFLFKEIVWAPPGKTARMIWAKFASNESYSELVKKVFEQLKKYQSKVGRVESRIPHITLARFEKKGKIESIPNFEAKERNLAAEEMILFQSKPTKLGSEYKEISSFELSG